MSQTLNLLKSSGLQSDHFVLLTDEKTNFKFKFSNFNTESHIRKISKAFGKTVFGQREIYLTKKLK